MDGQTDGQRLVRTQVTQRLIEKVANAMTAKTRKVVVRMHTHAIPRTSATSATGVQVGGKSVSIADVGYNPLGTDDGWQQ